jgi:hypothetical protein
MAAKKGIIWPLNTTIQAQTRLLATRHKLAESAGINQFLAESANQEVDGAGTENTLKSFPG